MAKKKCVPSEAENAVARRSTNAKKIAEQASRKVGPRYPAGYFVETMCRRNFPPGWWADYQGRRVEP